MELNEFEKIIFRGTNYEQQNNIMVDGYNVLYEADDVKLFLLKKSDGQRGLMLFYKAGGKWLFIYPTDTQIIGFQMLTRYYDIINLQNTNYWKTALKC